MIYMLSEVFDSKDLGNSIFKISPDLMKQLVKKY